MCELFAMSSLVPATVTLSLEELSRHGGAIGRNRDGWGVAYYDDGDVWLMKGPIPAAESACLRFIREHELRSTLVLSHIRRATQGKPGLRNTQPFSRELGGRMHVFAHNGDLRDVQTQPSLKLSVYHPVGDTDSEYAFCALMHAMRQAWLGDPSPPSLETRLEIVFQFARTIRELGPANFLYCDSELLFVHGHRRRQGEGRGIQPPGLHMLQRTCSVVPQRLEAAGLAIESASAPQEVVLVASVPLTDEPWTPLAEGEIVVLASGEVIARKAP